MIPSAGSSTSRQKKIYIWAAIALIVGVIIWLFLFLRHPKNSASQAASARNSVQARTSRTESYAGNTQIAPKEEPYSVLKDQPRPFEPSDQPVTPQVPHTPRNTGNRSRPFVENPIRSIALYTMSTYETENELVSLPAEVPYVPFGDVNDAYLESPDGTVRLAFIAPVRFEKQDDRHITVINNFLLQTNSDLYWSPVESLKNFDSILIPIIAAGYEGSLKTMVSFYCQLQINGRPHVWNYNAGSVPREQGGTAVRIPITEGVKQTFERKK